MGKQPWIGRPFTDIVFILLPPFLSLLVIILFPSAFQNNKDMPEAAWIILVLLIDVAHVYSTLYRTYFDPQALRGQRFLLWSIPFFGFVAGVLLYNVDSRWFWRILAYIAVFHFVRQQYGFMRVYSRKEPRKTMSSLIDTITIYTATIYPVLYWHLSGPANFNWFIEGDFFYVQAKSLLPVITVVYFIILALYLAREIHSIVVRKYFNLPKFAVISGTLVSWYFGIVYFNGDMAFTLLNVVSHGIPYMALVWIYGDKNYHQKQKGSSFLRMVFSKYGVALFLALIFVFAFVEEGIWDRLVWKEHRAVFGNFEADISKPLLSVLVPLLILPQLTHYILDGFIWKIKQDDFKWKGDG